MKVDLALLLRLAPLLNVALADGKLTTEEILGLAFAVGAGAVQTTPTHPQVPSIPGIPSIPGWPPASPPRPAPPETLLMPDAITVDITAIELGGTDITLKPGQFSVIDEGDHYQVVLGPESPTQNLPLRSRIDVSVGYLKNGKPFRFEDQTPPALHLYHTAQWMVTAANGQVVIGPGKDSELRVSGAEIAAIPRYSQTGGMDPTIKVHPAANDQVLAIGCAVPVAGVVNDKPIWLPLAS